MISVAERRITVARVLTLDTFCRPFPLFLNCAHRYVSSGKKDKERMVAKSYQALKFKARANRSPDTLQIENSKKTVYMALGGNLIITLSKVAAYMVSGSSAMLSEAIHSLVDSGNQALLLVGLTAADSDADGKYQYGYGKSIYFWSLVSALGTFWCGAGVSGWSSIQALMNPSVELQAIGWEVWSVLGVAFAVDGAVLYKTLQKININRPPNVSLLNHIINMRDPTTAAVLWEDAAACGGVLLAVGGISLVSLTHIVIFDALAGLSVSALLAAMGIYLARLNQRYLLGQAVEPEITEGIKKILMAGKSIDEVHSVQSQWVGPYSFSYKAEVDFDGTYIAAKLNDRYQSEFKNTQNMHPDEIRLLLSWYAEDVLRAVEMEVKGLEARIRLKYPEARYIELEPDGGKNLRATEALSYAIDIGGSATDAKKSEIQQLYKLQRYFIEEKTKNDLRASLEYSRRVNDSDVNDERIDIKTNDLNVNESFRNKQESVGTSRPDEKSS